MHPANENRRYNVNVVSHWLGARKKWSLNTHIILPLTCIFVFTFSTACWCWLKLFYLRLLCHNSCIFNLDALRLRKHKIIFASKIISQNWNGAGCWNLSSGKIATCLSSKVNTMAADYLATQGAWASAAMLLTLLSRNILVSAPGVY